MNYSLFRSRTFWSIVALFVISGTNGIMGMIPAGAIVYVQFALAALASYFHLDTAKTFGARN